ncbi:hypothetical protein F2Q69_00016341 [Brassica cretica]|uniref:Uncharacterized protein n=1 Tax=Brassica cretica TaxID=69181 RepID=A0A8S9QSE7_BRACR|nr:hypothetical protein F2Q69_00016341 [Brassica cretica]
MAPSFSYPPPTIKAERLEELYTVHGVDTAVTLDLASTPESPEAVRDGYGGAYLSFFETCGLFFPRHVLDILAELGLSFTQMCPNFLRLLLVLLARAREEGLLFGLKELCHLFMMKRNNQNPETFLMSPRPRRQIIQSAPLPRLWAEDIVHLGKTSMSPDLRGLIGVIRGGRSDWSSFDQPRIRAAFQLPNGLGIAPAFTSGSASTSKVARGLPPISIADSDDEDAPGEQKSPASLSPGSQDGSVVASRKRRRLSKVVTPKSSRSGRKSKGWKLVLEGDGPLCMGRGDLISLAQRTRSAECRPPSLVSPSEAYAKVVAASPKVVEAFNEFIVTMEDRIRALRSESEVEKGKAEVQRLSEEL